MSRVVSLLWGIEPMNLVAMWICWIGFGLASWLCLGAYLPSLALVYPDQVGEVLVILFVMLVGLNFFLIGRFKGKEEEAWAALSGGDKICLGVLLIHASVAFMLPMWLPRWEIYALKNGPTEPGLLALVGAAFFYLARLRYRLQRSSVELQPDAADGVELRPAEVEGQDWTSG
jgi:hypothetical protein